MPNLTFRPETGMIVDDHNVTVAHVRRGAHECDPALGARLAAGPKLLAALKIARSYVAVCLDEFREGQDELNGPSRSDRARAEDAETCAELEGHLKLIDAAIARAEQTS
jgi:hypothetical protein